MQEIRYSFVKVQKGLIVDDAQSTMLAGRWQHVIEVSEQREGCEVLQQSFSDEINTKCLHPRCVIDGLITAGVNWIGDTTGCLANMSQTTRRWATAPQLLHLKW